MTETPVVTWAVYTVPNRLERAQALAETICPGTPVLVQDPPDRDLRILNELSAWEAALSAQTDWVGVLQDDAILCKSFAWKASQRLKEAMRLPAGVVSFYSPKKADLEKMRAGERWRCQRGKGFLGAVCLAMRSSVAKAYCKRARERFSTERPWIDVANAEFFAANKLDVYVCLPNLTNHDFHIPSTLGHPGKIGGKPRHSRTFSESAK